MTFYSSIVLVKTSSRKGGHMRPILLAVFMFLSLTASAESFTVTDNGRPAWSGPMRPEFIYQDLVSKAYDICGEAKTPYMVSEITDVFNGKFYNTASFECDSPKPQDQGEITFFKQVGKRAGSFIRKDLLLSLYKVAGSECRDGYPRMVSELKVYGALASITMIGEFTCHR